MTPAQSLAKWLARCELALLYLAIFATGAMMVLTTADTASRYFLNRPILGAYEITEKYLMVAAIFLGLSYAYRGGAFIRVTFLVDRLSPALKLAADHFAHLVSLIYCIVFVLATGQQALIAVNDDTTLTTLPILVGPAYWLIPLGFLAMTILMLIDLPRVREGRAMLFQQDAPTS